MSDSPVRRSLLKRVLSIVGGFLVFVLVFIVACRLAVLEMFTSIEQSRATGLSATAWDARSMSASSNLSGSYYASVDLARSGVAGASIARSARLRTRSSSFDRAVNSLHQVVAAHHGYFDDLRTESSSGQGRLLSVELAFSSNEFDSALSDLKKIGQVVAISEAGQDAAIRLSSQARRVVAAQTNLARLQKLQRERTDKLLDALALEKEVAQANESVAEALRQQEALQSTVTQAHVSIALAEDYRSPLQASVDGEPLRLRNALVEGIGAIFSTVALVIAVLLEYGLPLLFWVALLVWPGRLVWRRLHRHTPTAALAE